MLAPAKSSDISSAFKEPPIYCATLDIIVNAVAPTIAPGIPATPKPTLHQSY